MGDPVTDPLAKTVGPATTAVRDHRSSFRFRDGRTFEKNDWIWPMSGSPPCICSKGYRSVIPRGVNRNGEPKEPG
jgi:hypothetical protein